MTENLEQEQAPATPPPTSGMRGPLRRSRDDRVLAGVAAGFARWLGIDPVIVRVVLVVLAVFGGSGLVLYLIGWLLIPVEGEQSSEAERLLREHGDLSKGRKVLIVLGIIAALIVFGSIASAASWGWGWGAGGWLLLLAAGGVVLWLVKGPVPPSSAPFVAAQAPVAAPTQESFVQGGVGAYRDFTPAPTVRVKTPPSYLGLATLSIALIVVGVLVIIDLSSDIEIPAVVTLASALGVLGLGLLVGAFAGRARWLIWLATPLLLVALVVAAIPKDISISGGVGDRHWVPTAAERSFRLGMGDATLDLRSVPLSAPVQVSASVGVGQLRIIVPKDARVQIDARVSLGEIDVHGRPPITGYDLRFVGELPGLLPEDAPVITLTTDVGIGNLEVSRA